eukprot:8722020-Alexandrium_andersonii.AAC.1
MAVYVCPAVALVDDSVSAAVAPQDLVSRAFLVLPGEIGFYVVVGDVGRRGWVELFEVVFWLPRHPRRWGHVVSS